MKKPYQSGFLATATLCLIFAGTLPADTFPDRTVTIVVPTSAGDAMDVIGRGLAQNLQAKWEKPVIVENRGGAGTLIGATAAAKAPPDGHTMLMAVSGTMLNAVIQRSINIEKDLTPVAHLADTPFVLAANASLPFTNIKGMIAHAKSNPGQLSYGTAGAGSLQHIAVEVLTDMTGTKMVAIPYAGTSPALTDLISGQIHVMFLPLGAALPQIVAGKLRALAIGSAERVTSAPDIPTIAESGAPGFSVVSWQLVMVPGSTPKAIIEKLNKDVHEAAQQENVRTAMTRLRLTARPPSSAEESIAFLRSELSKWMPVLHRMGLAK